jgi:hypothetical protein
MLVNYENVRIVKDEKHSPQGLSKGEEKTFKKLLKSLEVSQENKQLMILYRGEKKASLRRKLSEPYGTYKFFERLFYVGEKAKYFFKQCQDSLSNQDYLQSVVDVRDQTFEFIFKKLHTIYVDETSPKHPKTFERIQNFRNTQSTFVEFFSSSENLDVFLSKLRKEHNRIQIRDYYLYLIHTYSLGNISFLVSTSTDIQTAENFALKDEEDKRRCVVLYYFLPEPIHQYGVSFLSNQIAHSLCNKLDLPTYTHGFYPEQDEVAIKGALFPQFILGIFDLENEYFFVNPHIFEKANSNLNVVVKRGLFIEQSNFDEKIRETGYAGYITRWGMTGGYSDEFHR